MNASRWALYLAIGLASAALAAGYTLISLWPLAGLAIVLAASWYAGLHFKWRWLHGLELLAFWGLAAAGAFLGVGVIWLTLGLVAALAAWELAHFGNRMQVYPANDVLERVALRHLARLLIVSIVSIGLVGAALGARLHLPFGWAFVLALLALIGLSQAVGYLRRAGQ